MSETNPDGMRNFQNDQPDVFQMDDSSEFLVHEPFMSSNYTPPTEEKTEQIEPVAPETDQINYDEDPAKTELESEENTSVINYDDEIAPDKTDEFKAEEAIQKLEALGFKVDKDGQADPLQAKEFEIQNIDRINSDLKNFIMNDDLTLCREHVIEEIITEWKNQGKTPDIKSEEFQLEVNFQMAQFEDNPRLAKLQANDVKQILNNAIKSNEEKKTKIVEEVKTTRDKEIQTNRQALQGVFNGYNGKKLFGINITPDHLKNAYRSITSGDFTKQIEGDRALQAEFALFLGLRKDIENTGGGTYNEGVAAAIKALEGTGPKTESSLAQSVSRNGAGAVIDRISAWKNAEKVEEPKK